MEFYYKVPTKYCRNVEDRASYHHKLYSWPFPAFFLFISVPVLWRKLGRMGARAALSPLSRGEGTWQWKGCVCSGVHWNVKRELLGTVLRTEEKWCWVKITNSNCSSSLTLSFFFLCPDTCFYAYFEFAPVRLEIAGSAE